MSEGTDGLARVTIGALLGAAAASLIAPLIRPLFHVPTGGVGYVTIHQYPKAWDYAVVALLVASSFIGGAVASRQVPPPIETPRRPRWVPVAIAVFVLVFLIRDKLAMPLDLFHDGEQLTPAFQLLSGQRPYGEVFFNHGLAADGGLHALILGEGLSPARVRRLDAILAAATLSLLAAIAAEVCATTSGVVVATLAALCAAGVGVAGLTFPVLRIAPILLAALALLRYLRTLKTGWLSLAMGASTLGLLWSLDTGVFAVVGTAVLTIVIHAAGLGRTSMKTLIVLGGVAVLLPIIALAIVRADIPQFFQDSFVTVPRAIDAIGSLPAPDPPTFRELLFWLADEPSRYYVPPVMYGLLLALAFQRWRSGDRIGSTKIVVLTTFALLMFRSAAGRADPNHVRFALPLFGILLVAFIIEPLAQQSRVAATIAVSVLFILVLNVVPNTTMSAEALMSWPARQPSVQSVDIAPLQLYLRSFGPDATFLDFSNGLALYYLLERNPPVRVTDIKMLSAPPLLSEAMTRLRASPPDFVVLQAPGVPSGFDGLENEMRVPELAQWIKANYPRRLQVGKFLVAAR